MKLLDTTGKTLKKAAAAVAQAVLPAPTAPSTRDPFYSDDARRAALGVRERWLGRRPGRWLR